MPLYITEYAYLTKDVDGKCAITPKDPGVDHTAYAITTAAQNARTLLPATRFVRVAAHTASLVAIGAAPNASLLGRLLPANSPEIFGVGGDITNLINFKMFV